MSDRATERSLHRRAGRIVFGDRRGLFVWLVLLATFGLLWRFTLLVTDTNVQANLLVAVAEGHLAVEELRFPLDAVGEQHVQQGLRDVGGTHYGRNYGQVAVAVPVLWVLRGFSVLVDLRVLLAGGWSLTVLAAVQQGGVLSGRERTGRLVGAGLGVLLFLASLAVGTDVDGRLLPVVALQLVNVLAAAFVGVFVYRLVGRFEGTAVALGAGLVAGLATPVAFWASFPKRHVLVAALLAAGLFCFATSRTRSSDRTLARVGTYVAFGLVAWIHAFEGFFLVATLGVVDLTTTRTDRRELGLIAAGLGLALLPTFATNFLISGNPLVPPRLAGSGAGGGNLVTSSASVAAVPAAAVAASALVLSVLPEAVLEIVGEIAGAVLGGVATLGDPDRLWRIFVRSGNYGQYASQQAGYLSTELSMMESMPLLGGVVGLGAAGVRRVRSTRRLPSPRALRTLDPARQTDLLVGSLAAVFTVIYLSRLPLHSQFTVRYLLPVYVLGVYGLARLGPVKQAVSAAARTVAASYLLAVLATVILASVALGALDPARAEAVQAHALAHLGVGAVLAAAVVGALLYPRRFTDRVVGVVLGLVGGATTGYYLLAGLEYFTDGAYALDLARVLAEVVSIV